MIRSRDETGRARIVPGEMPAHCPHVYRDPEGIVCFDYSACSALTLSVVQRAYARHQALTGGERSAILLTGGRVGHVDYAAQRFASEPEVCAITAAVAIVVSSFLERHLARMFLMYHRPLYPVQVFGDAESVRAWLRAFLPSADPA
jgi:type IV secretory pathway TrbD component